MSDLEAKTPARFAFLIINATGSLFNWGMSAAFFYYYWKRPSLRNEGTTLLLNLILIQLLLSFAGLSQISAECRHLVLLFLSLDVGVATASVLMCHVVILRPTLVGPSDSGPSRRYMIGYMLTPYLVTIVYFALGEIQLGDLPCDNVPKWWGSISLSHVFLCLIFVVGATLKVVCSLKFSGGKQGTSLKEAVRLAIVILLVVGCLRLPSQIINLLTKLGLAEINSRSEDPGLSTIFLIAQILVVFYAPVALFIFFYRKKLFCCFPGTERSTTGSFSGGPSRGNEKNSARLSHAHEMEKAPPPPDSELQLH